MEQGRKKDLNTEQVYICTVITEENIALVLIYLFDGQIKPLLFLLYKKKKSQYISTEIQMFHAFFYANSWKEASLF